MRIFLISWYGSGGLLHYTSQLANALNLNNEVITLLPNHANVDYFSKEVKIRFLPIPRGYDYLGTFLTIINPYFHIKIYKLIRRENPEIIHITSSHPFSLIIFFYLTNYIKITTIHNVVPHKGEAGFFTMRFFYFINLCELYFSNGVIVHGNRIKTRILELFGNIWDEKIVTIPHGNYSFFKKYSGFTKPTNQEVFNILFFGRILDYKGLEYLIESEEDLSKSIPNLLITIAGEGNFDKYDKLIKNRQKFEVINRHIPDEEVGNLFEKSSIVVLPYIEGSQSGIIAIAYSFGKPVIATNVGSIPEIIEDGKTGYIIPIKDSKKLAERIIQIYSNESLRDKMSKRAYEKSEEVSWDKISQMHNEFYTKSSKMK